MSDQTTAGPPFSDANFFIAGTGKHEQIGFASLATTGCAVWVRQEGEQKKDPPIVARALLTGEAFAELCDWVLRRQEAIHVDETMRVRMEELEEWRKTHARR